MRISREEARKLGLLPKAKKRPKRPAPPDSFTPHECVTLAIDPGKRSGWAILLRGGDSWECFLQPPRKVRCYYGESTNEEEWWRAVTHAVDLAALHRVPLAVIMETWSQGTRASDPRMRAATLLGLGEHRGAWKRMLRTAKVPKCRVVTVHPQTWRARVLGGPMARSSAEWKSAAVAHAQAVFGHGAVTTAPRQKMGSDAAEAVCMARWGSRAGRVGEVVRRAGKRSP